MSRLIVGAGRTSNRIRIVCVSRRKGISPGKTLQSWWVPRCCHIFSIYLRTFPGKRLKRRGESP